MKLKHNYCIYNYKLSQASYGINEIVLKQEDIEIKWILDNITY